MTKKKDETTLKTLAIFGVIVLGAITLSRSCKSIKDNIKREWDTPKIDPEISKDQQMTLIGKSESLCFFDTDGDKYTTEIVALNMGKTCCFNQIKKMNDTKLNKTQSLKDWQKDLFCHSCGKRGHWKIQKVGKDIHIWE